MKQVQKGKEIQLVGRQGSEAAAAVEEAIFGFPFWPTVQQGSQFTPSDNVSKTPQSNHMRSKMRMVVKTIVPTNEAVQAQECDNVITFCFTSNSSESWWKAFRHNCQLLWEGIFPLILFWQLDVKFQESKFEPFLARANPDYANYSANNSWVIHADKKAAEEEVASQFNYVIFKGMRNSTWEINFQLAIEFLSSLYFSGGMIEQLSEAQECDNVITFCFTSNSSESWWKAFRHNCQLLWEGIFPLILFWQLDVKFQESKFEPFLARANPDYANYSANNSWVIHADKKAAEEEVASQFNYVIFKGLSTEKPPTPPLMIKRVIKHPHI
ncbi:hypothetical protein CAPTEDRAFT_204268 [Capitella teleta]|uniref:Uncharacterized protein n=1 Tax=Capitella teleta TaxID=283909 RepID=R7U6H7_CAPTE|nr:hypothetical protein CAPTEDRAFT_204268 [Capitella teleta]|eukprot:ELU01930.1 hypothetical protein CAPTEDRAFT_204268 [Capitella teleta]